MQLSQRSSGKSVKIVAIAKDEAPYIAEWVHHHLWFGFDYIHIYVNRTSDKTLDILSSINKEYPNVTYENIDWIDWVGVETVSRKLQSVSYSLAFHNAKSTCSCDYILFIDIDEFWMSRDMEASIGDCLKELGYPGLVSFEWERVFGEEDEFSHIPNKVYVDRNGLVKSLISTSLNIKKMRLHVPLVTDDNCNHVLADGARFRPLSYDDPGFSQFVANEISYSKKYFILHRMYRSEKEYISTLMRGNPEQRTSIKFNRKGFMRPSDDCDVIFFPENRFLSYRNSLLSFYVECKIVDLIDKAKEEVLCAYGAFLKQLPLLYLRYTDKMEIVMRGVEDVYINHSLDDLRRVAEGSEKRINEKNITNADELRDLAFEFEREGDLYSAYYIMCRAHKLRPRGPLIKRKMSRYEEKIAN